MTSKKDRTKQLARHLCGLPDEPKTPHEEVMFVVESNNEIVSKILELLESGELFVLKPQVRLTVDLNKLMNDIKKEKKG